MAVKPSSYAVAVDKVFERLENIYFNQKLNQIEGKDLLELSGIFGNLLPEALDIIDLDKITIHQNLSRHRKYIEIIEDHGTVCKLLPNINYCTCSIFHEKVILSNELYSCKHILAFRLASLIGKVKVREASTDAAFAYSMRMIKPMTDV